LLAYKKTISKKSFVEGLNAMIPIHEGLSSNKMIARRHYTHSTRQNIEVIEIENPIEQGVELRVWDPRATM
jgi:hypothetical protein